MPYMTRDLGSIVTSSTGALTNILGHLDDAASVTIYVSSSAAALTSSGVVTVKVAPWDFADSTDGPLAKGVSFTTAFYTLNLNSSTSGSPLVLTSGNAYLINNISFRSLRLNFSLSSGNTDGEVVAWATKQISV